VCPTTCNQVLHPGGASSQWLVGIDEHLDAPLDMDFVQQTFGVMLGSGAIMSTTRPSIRARRVALAKFFAHESCGKCTPCREARAGSRRSVPHVARLGRPEDLDCCSTSRQHLTGRDERAVHPDDDLPLGPSAVSCIASLHKYFRAEIEQQYIGAPREREDHADRDRRRRLVRGPAGELVIKAAQDHGIYIRASAGTSA